MAEIRRRTAKPIGMNVIVERSSKVYEERMQRYVDLAIEEGVRFFVTSLGNPRWVVAKAHAAGGLVYHDVTERKWAEKGLAEGVDGLIAVNDRAGGHAGPKSAEALLEELATFGVPVVCAGGIGDEADFVHALQARLRRCPDGDPLHRHHRVHRPRRLQAGHRRRRRGGHRAHRAHHRRAGVGDPHALRRAPRHRAGPIARWLLRAGAPSTGCGCSTPCVVWRAQEAPPREPFFYRDYLQAGKSVAGIHAIEPAGEIVRRFKEAAERA